MPTISREQPLAERARLVSGLSEPDRLIGM